MAAARGLACLAAPGRPASACPGCHPIHARCGVCIQPCTAAFSLGQYFCFGHFLAYLTFRFLRHDFSPPPCSLNYWRSLSHYYSHRGERQVYVTEDDLQKGMHPNLEQKGSWLGPLFFAGVILFFFLLMILFLFRARL
jgi:hypothetical protein